MRRSTLAAVAVLGGLLVALAHAAAPPPLVFFHAQPRPPAEVVAAREAVARVAADAGAAFLDGSPAAPPPPAAPAQLARAIELYDGLRLDEAAAALDAALTEARASGGAGLRPNELSDLFLYRALVFTQRGDANRAWEELVRCLVLEPTRVLDPARFPPRAVQAFQRAAAQVRALPTGRLAPDAAPACTVTVDGRDVTAATPGLPFGEHFVRVECPGELPAGAVVALTASRQELTLARVPVAAPADEVVVRLAAERGAASVLIVTVTASAAASPTARLRLRAVPAGSVLAETAAALPAGGSGAAITRAAAERLIARAEGPTAPTLPPPAPRESRWYEKPWLWGVVGAGVAAAVLVPIAVSGHGSATTLTVRPVGAWPP